MNIKSTITTHVKTERHKIKLQAFNARTSEDVALMADLSSYFQSNPDLAGGTVTPNEQLYRYRVTEAFLHAGIPLAKLAYLRYLLERSGNAFVPKSLERRWVRASMCQRGRERARARDPPVPARANRT